MQQTMKTTKEHYKSYKAGKYWVFACLTIISLGLTLAQTTENVKADTGEIPATENVVPEKIVTQDESEIKPAGKISDTANAEKQPEVEKRSDSEIPKNDAPESVNKQDKEKKSETQVEISEVSKNAGAIQRKAPKSLEISKTKRVASEQPEQSSPTVKTVPVVETATVATTLPDTDASKWMPDEHLRVWIEGQLNQFHDVTSETVNDANLYVYAKQIKSLTVNYFGEDVHAIKNFDGLNRLTGLTIFDFDQYIPKAKMIDFSFAPNLTKVTLTSLAAPVGNSEEMNAKDFFDKYLSQNSALTDIYISNYGLTGNLPDISRYKNLINLNLDSNKLSGPLADLNASSTLEYLQLSDNRLSGNVPDLLRLYPSLKNFYLNKNQLTGNLPNLSGFTGDFMVNKNHLTSGFQNATNNSNQADQQVTGKTYILTSTVRSFDPITGVIAGMQGNDGQIDKTEPIVIGDFGPAKQYFDIEPDPSNPVGFNLVAKGEVPDGTYTILVWNKTNYHYWATLTFMVKNENSTIVPPTPTPEPTPEPTPDPNPDVVPEPTEPGATDTNESETTDPENSGDAVTGTPEKSKNSQSAKPVTESEGQTAKVVAPKALSSSGQHQAAATTNQPKTTLPQTNERNGASLLAVGVALIIATFGMGLTAKHHE